MADQMYQTNVIVRLVLILILGAHAAGKGTKPLSTLRLSSLLVIIIAPSSLTAPLYTLVNFTCEGTGKVLYWAVDGNKVTDPSNQDREISVTTNNISVDVWSSVLTIRTLPINDGISVGCTVVGLNFVPISKGANLAVKG